ncbi:unnamed protein product [Xylocopa violacea]|uniref:Uncharacterized protein n=1 Tax=Xylocopa violacea TaxID=135666 RepID=A0ABP1NM83_XYLVO
MEISSLSLDLKIQKDSINEQKNGEYTEDCKGLSNRSYNRLKIEYERCRQENCDFKRNLKINETMYCGGPPTPATRGTAHLSRSHKHSFPTGFLYNRISDVVGLCEHPSHYPRHGLYQILAKNRENIVELQKQIDQSVECPAIINLLANLSLEEDNLFLTFIYSKRREKQSRTCELID